MYTLELSARAQANLRRLDAAIQARVRTKLRRLCQHCDLIPHRALKGPHRGKFTIEVAEDYRILYSVNRQTREILVDRIGYRSRIY